MRVDRDQARCARDLANKASRTAVDFAQERGAAVIAIGDVRDLADGKRLRMQPHQKVSQWSQPSGQVRSF